MKNFKIPFFILVFLISLNAYGGYDCYQLRDENGGVGPSLVNLYFLEEDPSSLSSLRSPLSFEGSTFVKYQFWADAGDGYYLVHFVGIEDSLNESGEAVLATQNLFCKSDGFVEEGGL